MKSYNHLFEKVISYENIELAIINSAKGKKKRYDVRKIFANKDYHIKTIIYLLENKLYNIPNHKVIEINDGFKQKKRHIIKPFYKYEQIVHHAIIQVIKPIIMKGMYEYSCGSIPDRGGSYGKKYIEKFIRNNKSDIKYCYKMDIHHFYESVSSNKIKELLAKKIHDKDMLYLLYMHIDSYSDFMSESDEFGIPIGYYTSQWISNWYLQGLDHYIKENLKAKCYVRYADDMIIFGRNKKKLHEIRKLIEKYLKNKLGLQMKGNWQVFRFDYISKKDGKRKGRCLDFMGYKFYRDKTTLRKSILYRARKKANRISKKENPTWYDGTQIMSYLGWGKRTNTKSYYFRNIKSKINIRSLKNKISKRSKMYETNHLQAS